MKLLKRDGKNKGFTLIELLVVLVIIGVVVSAIGLSLKRSPRGQDARSATVILQARMLSAEQVSLMESSLVGFSVTQNGYQFYRLKHKQNTLVWEAISKGTLMYQPFEEHFDIALSLPNYSEALVPDSFPAVPMIIFNAGGGVTPFTLKINGYTITGKYNGAITIQ